MSGLSELVRGQPTPHIFFDVFLELQMSSLINHLASDSKSVKALLDDKNKQYFSSEFPLFYKQRDGRSAIDSALDANQVRSVNAMIRYLLEYQNRYVYANLFRHNFVDLVNKSVRLDKLLGSRIFNHVFDFDAWPATSPETDKILKPYNSGVFAIRTAYASTFAEMAKADDIRAEKAKNTEGTQSFKRMSTLGRAAAKL